MTPLRTATLLAVGATLVFGRPASAYVRYLTESGKGFFWPQAAVSLTVYPNDFVQPTMTADQIDAAAEQAAAAWSSTANPCTYLNLTVNASTAPTPIAQPDNHNTLIFRSTSWCPQLPNGSCETDYDPSALAVTSDTANKVTGQLYDSDIEVNALDYTWADVLSDGGLSGDMDLQNAITHEMGHLIGLDHTCYNAAPGNPQPYDAAGLPVPACPASAAVQATTMYPSAMPGDTQKRTLAPDDQAGVCGIYPVDDPPAPPGGCISCATAPSPAGGIGLCALGLFAALVGRARRVRRRSRR
jgi:hypothetical protein